MPETPTRVLHGAWEGTIGGAERAVHLLVREQVRDPRTEPGLLYGAGGLYTERVAAEGVPTVVLGARSAYDLLVLPRAVRVMRGYRVHHVQGPEPLLILA